MLFRSVRVLPEDDEHPGTPQPVEAAASSLRRRPSAPLGRALRQPVLSYRKVTAVKRRSCMYILCRGGVCRRVCCVPLPQTDGRRQMERHLEDVAPPLPAERPIARVVGDIDPVTIAVLH